MRATRELTAKVRSDHEEVRIGRQHKAGRLPHRIDWERNLEDFDGFALLRALNQAQLRRCSKMSRKRRPKSSSC